MGTLGTRGGAVAYEWITDALEETWDAIDRLLSSLSPERYDAPTPCPGWSVRDVLSHLVGFELLIQGQAAPEGDVSGADHVRNAIGELNERFVAARRAMPGADVLEEFREVSASSLVRLRALSAQQWETPGWSPEGEVPLHRFQETRILDSWIHLQDLRDALAEPEDDHGPGEEIVVNRFEAAMPFVFARRAGAPEGSTLRLNLVGRLARTVLLEVRDGRGHAVGSLGGEPSVEMTTPVALFWRRAAGRISAAAFLAASATDVRGDRALASAFAEAMAIMI
jgi:uncharacterized protein (TIGR03083 family)